MSEHDVTKSSNPDVQALLVVITALARRVEAQAAQLQALQAQFDSLPSQFVVPGPDGGVPAGTVTAGAGLTERDAEILAAQVDDAQAGADEQDDDIPF